MLQKKKLGCTTPYIDKSKEPLEPAENTPALGTIHMMALSNYMELKMKCRKGKVSN